MSRAAFAGRQITACLETTIAERLGKDVAGFVGGPAFVGC